jgi:HlyD family secretion protein
VAAPEPTVTAPIVRGDIADAVGATGTLQAVTTVQVGTQVSGTILELHADFNSLVKKGQVLARLDPSLFQTQIEQARANLIRAQADLERLRVTLDDARTKLSRAKELAGRQLIPQNELDTADVNVRSAEAQIRSSQAQVTQAQASLNQNQVNLDHTVILAPIDGLVISRNVDIGQTVAASMQAPTLFVLAADLTKMQVLANLDESDVGRIRPTDVRFRVDAYPTDDFIGTVSQVRLQPIVQQNVVTYATVIDVPNPELKLKPGMTANVNIEIARATNVVRVPNAALRFRPTNDIYAALKQTPPEPPGRGDPGAGAAARAEGAGGAPSSATPPSAPAAAARNPPASCRRRGGRAGGAMRGRPRGAPQDRRRARAYGTDARPAPGEQMLERMERPQRRRAPLRAGAESGCSAPGDGRLEEPHRHHHRCAVRATHPRRRWGASGSTRTTSSSPSVRLGSLTAGERAARGRPRARGRSRHQRHHR